MRTITSLGEMTVWAEENRSESKKIGFVPTMGYFHEGHLSLIRAARRENDRVVVSVFVNPMQFGPKEDFDQYPRDMARDRSLAEAEGTDIFFSPKVEEVYPPGHVTTVAVRRLSDVLCGAFRPGHFAGVATVVLKLLNVVRPDSLYLGEKDFQQAVVLERMIRDLHLGVEVRLGVTVREPDGLAMSSRNAYLSPAERDAAAAIYRSLCSARALVQAGEKRPHALVAEARRILEGVPLVRVEYVSAVDPRTLEDIVEVTGPTLVAVAARVGATRLIDSMLLRPGHTE